MKIQLAIIFLILFSVNSQASLGAFDSDFILKANENPIQIDFTFNMRAKHDKKYHYNSSLSRTIRFNSDTDGLGVCVHKKPKEGYIGPLSRASYCAITFINSFHRRSNGFGFKWRLHTPVYSQHVQFYVDMTLGLMSGYREGEQRMITKYDMAFFGLFSVGTTYWINPRLGVKANIGYIPETDHAIGYVRVTSLELSTEW